MATTRSQGTFGTGGGIGQFSFSGGSGTSQHTHTIFAGEQPASQDVLSDVERRIVKEVRSDIHRTFFGTLTGTGAAFGVILAMLALLANLWLFTGFFALGTVFMLYAYRKRDELV